MEEGKKEKKKVMVAIDESEFSHYALKWAIEYLKDTIVDSELVIFTAQPNTNFGYVYASSMGSAPPELIINMQEKQKMIAFSLLEKAKELCAHHGVVTETFTLIVAETLTEVGDPKEAICEAVEKLKIQLLIIGSHSRGAIQRAFLGSVSNYCVHNAKCPVLVVKKPI